jgi:hypothetical protein
LKTVPTQKLPYIAKDSKALLLVNLGPIHSLKEQEDHSSKEHEDVTGGKLVVEANYGVVQNEREKGATLPLPPTSATPCIAPKAEDRQLLTVAINTPKKKGSSRIKLISSSSPHLKNC